MTLKNIILSYIANGHNVTRAEVLKARLGRWSDVRKAFAELNQQGCLWFIGDGTVEVAGEVAKL